MIILGNEIAPEGKTVYTVRLESEGQLIESHSFADELMARLYFDTEIQRNIAIKDGGSFSLGLFQDDELLQEAGCV